MITKINCMVGISIMLFVACGQKYENMHIRINGERRVDTIVRTINVKNPMLINKDSVEVYQALFLSRYYGNSIEWTLNNEPAVILE